MFLYFFLCIHVYVYIYVFVCFLLFYTFLPLIFLSNYELKHEELHVVRVAEFSVALWLVRVKKLK